MTDFYLVLVEHRAPDQTVLLACNCVFRGGDDARHRAQLHALEKVASGLTSNAFVVRIESTVSRPGAPADPGDARPFGPIVPDNPFAPDGGE